MKQKILKYAVIGLVIVNFLMAGLAWQKVGVGIPTLAVALITCLVVAIGTQGITLNKYVVLDKQREKGAELLEKDKKKLNMVLAMLGLMIVLTAISVYIYTTSGGDRSIKQEQSVTVTVNNNQPDTSDLLDLNQATKDQLEALPGIGEALAEEIINARPFYSVEELKRVPGIGEKIYMKVRGLVKVD